jgi:hypothetical protein
LDFNAREFVRCAGYAASLKRRAALWAAVLANAAKPTRTLAKCQTAAARSAARRRIANYFLEHSIVLV